MIKGKDIIIKIGNETLAACKSCDISVDCDSKETAGSSSGKWKEFIAGRCGWSLSTSHLVVNGNFAEFLTGIIGRTLTVKIGHITGFDQSVDTVSGSVICTSAKVSASVGNLATGSFQFQGTGVLS